MKEVKEELVSYELAVILQKAGFDGFVHNYYCSVKGLQENQDLSNYNSDDHCFGVYSAPTLSHVQTWLRVVHSIDVLPKLRIIKEELNLIEK
tara:strand:+ start:75 stop:350 length:276 start_codon:yes stop_codon:yes gene_type:complete